MRRSLTASEVAWQEEAGGKYIPSFLHSRWGNVNNDFGVGVAGRRRKKKKKKKKRLPNSAFLSVLCGHACIGLVYSSIIF